MKSNHLNIQSNWQWRSKTVKKLRKYNNWYRKYLFSSWKAICNGKWTFSHRKMTYLQKFTFVMQSKNKETISRYYQNIISTSDKPDLKVIWTINSQLVQAKVNPS